MRSVLFRLTIFANSQSQLSGKNEIMLFTKPVVALSYSPLHSKNKKKLSSNKILFFIETIFN